MEAADTAWVMAAFALVSLMFPGLAFLYGGVMGRNYTLNMFMMVMSSVGVTAVVYVLYGHGLVLGDSLGGLGIIGNPTELLGFSPMTSDDGGGGTIWGAFYVLFAAISVALVASGAAGRMKFSAWMVFVVLWVTFVYAPLGHWVFAISDEATGYIGGWMINVLEFHDFAGGTAVHMNAGAAGLALALVLGARRNQNVRPHSLPLTLLGAGLIAAGWFGFNGGTAGGANFLAEYVIMTSLLALAGGMLGYTFVERMRDGHFTLLGLSTGMIAGLVGITPSADAVGPVGALLVGFLSAAAACWATGLKRLWNIDDTADVFAVHGVSGIVGVLFVMLVGNPDAPAGVAGVLRGGDPGMLWRDPLAIVVTLAFSFGMTWLLATIVDKTMGIRISAEEEEAGIDASIHAESAYSDSGARPSLLSNRTATTK